MRKLLELLFGKKQKQVKDLIKHPDHQHCDFGITEFNKTKRSKEFLEEIGAKRGHGKPQPPPPTQPPPTSTNSPAIIYLNFNGGTTSNTQWNISGDIVYEDSGMTFDEQQSVINLVAAFFSGFNVTVTNDQSVYLAASVNRRQQVNLTQSWEWYGQAGGVAFRNSMFWGSDTPCWVFTSLLGYSASHIGEAATHEPGHTIGLYHQSTWDANCVKIAEYNKGDGVNSPIMGYPYNLPSKWWVGTDSVSCTEIQDDAAVMSTNLK